MRVDLTARRCSAAQIVHRYVIKSYDAVLVSNPACNIARVLPAAMNLFDIDLHVDFDRVLDLRQIQHIPITFVLVVSILDVD